MPESRIPPIAYAILLIACFCIYGIIVLPETTFAGMDFVNLNYPRVALEKDALTHGVLPLWNWYEWGGAPLLAAMQGALFYPPAWVAMAIPLPYGLQLFVFCHLYLAGVGACLLAWRLAKLPLWACVLAGIIYMGNAFFVGRIEQFQIMAVNCLLPWLVLAINCAIKRNPQGAAWLAIVWALTLVAGHPQYAVFNLLGALGFLGLQYLFSRKRKSAAISSRKPLLATIWMVASGLALGTGAAMAQLLPTWELGQLSERIWPYPDPTLPELAWSNLPALIIPHYYNIITGQSGRVFGFTELGLYAGLLAIPLAVAALIGISRSNKLRRPLIITAATMWGLAMIFALGRNGFIASIVYDYFPFFKQSRGAARSLNVASLMLALLSASGAEYLLGLLRNRTSKTIYAGWLLCSIFCADIALQNIGTLKSILVPAQALAVKPIGFPSSSAPNPGLLYRFMAFDSDLFLNNSTAAVAERAIRIQPNLGSLQNVPVTDGYEEGLLPTRTRANLFRRYNRNFRDDSPDASLLAFLGSQQMLTEFPLPGTPHWSPVSPEIIRPGIVPQMAGQPTAYRYWKSHYPIKVPVLGVNGLLEHQDVNQWLDNVGKAFPPSQNWRAATEQNRIEHPLSHISPQMFEAAQSSVTGFVRSWNRLSFDLSEDTSQALVLLNPYPGWKLLQIKSTQNNLISLCSLFYLLEVGHSSGNKQFVEIVFAPYSFRLGLFISISSIMQILILFSLPFVRNFKKSKRLISND